MKSDTAETTPIHHLETIRLTFSIIALYFAKCDLSLNNDTAKTKSLQKVKNGAQWNWIFDLYTELRLFL